MEVQCDWVPYDQEGLCGHLKSLSLLHVLLTQCFHLAGLQYFPFSGMLSIIRGDRYGFIIMY